MAHTIFQLPDEPIVVFKAEATGSDSPAEYASVAQDFKYALDQVTTPIFLIMDLSRAGSLNLDGLMASAASVAHGEESPFHHPNMRQVVVVTHNPVIRMAAEGLGHDVYGNLYVPVFENYEDALAYVHSQL